MLSLKIAFEIAHLLKIIFTSNSISDGSVKSSEILFYNIHYLPLLTLTSSYQVKWVHTQYVKDVPPYCGAVPEYPAWFEPFVMQWLNENDDVSLEYLNGAFNRDKRDMVSV